MYNILWQPLKKFSELFPFLANFYQILYPEANTQHEMKARDSKHNAAAKVLPAQGSFWLCPWDVTSASW